MINYLAHADGSEHPHVGNSAVPTSLYIIVGITIIAIATAFVVVRLLSKKAQIANEETNEDT